MHYVHVVYSSRELVHVAGAKIVDRMMYMFGILHKDNSYVIFKHCCSCFKISLDNIHNIKQFYVECPPKPYPQAFDLPVYHVAHKELSLCVPKVYGYLWHNHQRYIIWSFRL